MKSASKINFGIPETSSQLEQLLRFRKQVYQSEPEFEALTAPNDLDLSAYDLRSVCFGAWMDDEPIACVRIVLAEESFQGTWIRELAHQEGITLDNRLHAFPFQHYYPDAQWSTNFVESLGKSGECGKLAIAPDWRDGSLLMQIWEQFIPYCRDHLAVETGFGSCPLALERFYKRLGFTRAEGCEPFGFGNLPQAVIVRFDEK